MSGNIQDTDVNLVKTQVYNLLNDLSDSDDRNEEFFKRKYKYLATHFGSLFKYIVSSYGTTRFNQRFFDQTLTMMLNKVQNIQENRISQHDASVSVGTHLAQTYIPHLNDTEK
jgi:hypothetical protein